MSIQGCINISPIAALSKLQKLPPLDDYVDEVLIHHSHCFVWELKERGESGSDRGTEALLMRSWISCSLIEHALCPKVDLGSSSSSSPKTCEPPLDRMPDPLMVRWVLAPPAFVGCRVYLLSNVEAKYIALTRVTNMPLSSNTLSLSAISYCNLWIQMINALII